MIDAALASRQARAAELADAVAPFVELARTVRSWRYVEDIEPNVLREPGEALLRSTPLRGRGGLWVIEVLATIGCFQASPKEQATPSYPPTFSGEPVELDDYCRGYLAAWKKYLRSNLAKPSGLGRFNAEARMLRLVQSRGALDMYFWHPRVVGGDVDLEVPERLCRSRADLRRPHEE